MRPKHSGHSKASAERVVKDIRWATQRHFSAEDKIRIVLEGGITARLPSGSATLHPRPDMAPEAILH
jgi:hypothetical protein